MKPRVLSLLPAATQILNHIEGTHLLVGCTTACSPSSTPEVSPSIPRISPADLSSITSLRPDLILAPPPLSPLLSQLLPSASILTIDPRSIESIFDDVLRVGTAANLESPARHAVVAMRNRMFDAAECVNPYVEGPIVGFLSSLDPPFVAGEWIVQLIERAGGRHPWNPTTAREGVGEATGPQHGERSAPPGFPLSTQQWLRHPAEMLILCPAPNPDHSSPTLPQTLPAWLATTPAGLNGRVAQVPGPCMHIPGPGLVETFTWLVAWINDRPELAPPGFAALRRHR